MQSNIGLVTYDICALSFVVCVFVFDAHLSRETFAQNRVGKIAKRASGVAMGVGRHLPPLFCQDGARDFFKIDEKIVGRGSS